MTKLFSPFLMGLMLSTASVAFAPAAFAQTADAPSDAATDAAPAADPNAGLNMGTPADQAAAGSAVPRVGQPYIREEIGDWALRCLKAEEGQLDPCQMYQLLLDDDGNAVAEVSMFPLPDGGRAVAGATIVVPLETMLTEQLRLSVDGSTPRLYPFTFCNAAGCVSRVGFTAEEVAQFRAGGNTEVRMVPAAAPDQEVILNMSLSGFTAAFDSADTAQ